MPRKSWWARLPFGVRMVAGTGALLIVIGGGAAGVAVLTRDDAKPRIVTAVGDAAAGVAGGTAPQQPAQAPEITKGQIAADAARSRTAAEADRTATRNPLRATAPAGARTPAQAAPQAEGSAPAAKSPAQPVITTRTETETREIPYATRLVRDPSLPRGSRQVQTPGVAGEETLRYLVTLTDGRPSGRRFLDSTVTRQPQPQIVAFGVQDDDGMGQGERPGRGPRGEHHGHCRAALDFCVPLGHGGSCRGEEDQRLEDASANQLGGEVAVTNTDVGVLSGTGTADRC